MTYAGQLWEYFPNAGPRYFGAFYDFLSDREVASTEWTPVNHTAGGTAAVTAIDTINGGYAQLVTGDATSTHGGGLIGTAGCIMLAVNTVTEITAKLAVATVSTLARTPTVGGLSMGLAATALTLDGAANGVYLSKDGDANWDAVIYTGSAAVLDTDTGADHTDAADSVLGIRIAMGAVSGSGTVYFYVDGSEVARYVGTGLPASTTVLYPVINVTNTSAVQKVALIDYIGWRQTRV